MRRVKAVSVSAELTTIQRAVEGAGLLVEIGRQGGVEDEDGGAFISAILALAAVRLRDLGRVMRGTMDVERFRAPHNIAPEGGAGEGGQDVTLKSSPTSEPVRKRRR